MAEYIEKDAILRHLADVQFGEKTAQMWDGVEDAMQAVIHFPAADVVPVVRCKDCKYRHDDGFCGGRGWPAQIVPDDGYCDKGARKDGDA